MGIPFSTVGVSVFAKDMSSGNAYEKVVKYFQVATKIGALLIGPLPGMIADLTGSYAPAYLLLAQP